jgi:hypothetical protein
LHPIRFGTGVALLVERRADTPAAHEENGMTKVLVFTAMVLPASRTFVPVQ